MRTFVITVLLGSFSACAAESPIAGPDPSGSSAGNGANAGAGGKSGAASGGSSGSGGDAAAREPVDPDLVAHWKLDEQSGTEGLDATGNGHAAAVSGAAWSAGLAGGALAFDGDGDHARVDDLSYGPELTISLWFSIGENSGSIVNYLFNHGEQSTPDSVRVFVFEDGDPNGNAGKLRTIVRDSNDASDVEIDVPAGLTDGDWHLYTLTVAPGAGARVYVDGVERAACEECGGDVFDPATSIALGARADLLEGRFLNGALDDVRIYDRALSAPEIAAIHAEMTSSSPSDGGTDAPPVVSDIDPADVLHHAQADVPFAQHSGYSGQVLGTYPSCKSIPEYPDGIHGSTLPGGETLRMGKVLDPEDSSRKAFQFQLAPSDTSTSGSKRCEFSFSPNIELGVTYWIGLSVYVYDWGNLASGDKSLFGTQVHSGDNSLGLSPSVSINTAGGDNRSFEIQGRYQTNLGSNPGQSNSTTVRSDVFDIPFETWTTFAIKFRHDLGSGGALEAYRDGALIWTYQGRLGFDTPGFEDYVKFGYYNWSGAFSSPRKVLLRSPLLLRDPTGSKYLAEDVTAFVSSH